MKTRIFLLALFAPIFTYGFTLTVISDTSENFHTSTYSLTGSVFTSPNESPVSDAEVRAYQHGTSNLVAEGKTDENGNYTLVGVSGEIDVIAFPNDIIENDYVPTWYPSATDQTSATSINVTSNRSGINIALQPR